jgi:hypothetical protein
MGRTENTVPLLLWEQACLWRSYLATGPHATLYRHFFFSKGCACDVCYRPRMVITLQLLCYSLLKAACPERFPEKLRAGPGVPPSSLFFSEGCALDVPSFISKGANPSTMSSHSLLAAWQKTRLLTSWPPFWESAWWSCWMSSRFLDVTTVLHLGPLFTCCFLGPSLVSSRSLVLYDCGAHAVRDGMVGHPSLGGGQFLLGPTSALGLFLQLLAVRNC